MIDVDSSIRSSNKFLHEQGLLLNAGMGSSFKASSDFLRISRSGANYKEIYDSGIQGIEYNFLINDGSFFQFSKNDQGLRYAYYPTPYNYDSNHKGVRTLIELMSEGEFKDQEIDQLVSEYEYTLDIPFIRYDLSYDDYCERFHPAAHLHVGLFVENRWPVKRVLTPFSFLLKILSIYYIEWWSKSNDESEDFLIKKYILEVSNCPRIDNNYFKESENGRFYIT